MFGIGHDWNNTGRDLPSLEILGDARCSVPPVKMSGVSVSSRPVDRFLEVTILSRSTRSTQVPSRSFISGRPGNPARPLRLSFHGRRFHSVPSALQPEVTVSSRHPVTRPGRKRTCVLSLGLKLVVVGSYKSVKRCSARKYFFLRPFQYFFLRSFQVRPRHLFSPRPSGRYISTE